MLQPDGKKFEDVLVDLFLRINQAAATSDYKAYSELVDLLENYLYAYIDKEYETKIKEFEERIKTQMKQTKPRNLIESMNLNSSIQKKIVNHKLRCLVELARRRGLIPIGKNSPTE